MDIIKTTLIFLITLILTACGGDSDPDKEIIFPEHLPEVNPNLSQENRSGIWMSYRLTEIVTEDITNEVTEKYITQLTNKELSIIDEKEGIHTIPLCTFNELYEGFDLKAVPSKNGYRYEYVSSPNNLDDYSNGYLNISYINNQKLFGEGSRVYRYKVLPNYSRQETTTIYAIKISDSTDFNLSDDIEYLSNIDTELSTETDPHPLCIGLAERKTTGYSDNIQFHESHTQYAQQFAIGENDLNGIEIFDSLGSIKNEKLKRIGGAYINDDNYMNPWLKNIECDISDAECLSQAILTLNIPQNDSSGISFNARLDSDDGSFLDINVSAIIQPVIATQND